MILGTRSAAEQSFLNHFFLTPFWSCFPLGATDGGSGDENQDRDSTSAFSAKEGSGGVGHGAWVS